MPTAPPVPASPGEPPAAADDGSPYDAAISPAPLGTLATADAPASPYRTVVASAADPEP